MSWPQIRDGSIQQGFPAFIDKFASSQTGAEAAPWFVAIYEVQDEQSSAFTRKLTMQGHPLSEEVSNTPVEEAPRTEAAYSQDRIGKQVRFFSDGILDIGTHVDEAHTTSGRKASSIFGLVLMRNNVHISLPIRSPQVVDAPLSRNVRAKRRTSRFDTSSPGAHPGTQKTDQDAFSLKHVQRDCSSANGILFILSLVLSYFDIMSLLPVQPMLLLLLICNFDFSITL
ncbi:uncharacterized protein MYCFIDRAFT_206880 [Pseudocercospora fijiensis CIRAD86]|uniref:Uncharacterized protein n=1 Tax=Pseudocercospora fijiensis (strain CIRAD86) TaxID=383855 RepID=M2Z9V0_PSEFD|nr:uncharacterized protein MYCFIDRAFT_206880 [Pseudocercospora fijiensis CIRAD86]EME86620.1 hypothetical protein MYCFIDRAFT_206880 [Pseudocercospora fijiensis CIRAD86]